MPNSVLSETHKILPQLLERAKQAETAACLSSATVNWLRRGGVVRILDEDCHSTVPEKLFALGNAGRLLGSACLSTAWTAMLYALHYWLLRRFGPKVHSAVLRRTRTPLIAAAFQPEGSAVKRRGAYEISGQWSWVSGINHSDWVLINAVTEQARVPRFFLVPTNDVTIVKDRQLMGMQGTGTHSIVLDKVLVTSSLSLEEETLRSCHSPGTAIESDALVRCPVQPVLVMIGSSIGLGAAEGIMNRLLEMLGRKDGTTGERLRARSNRRVGEVVSYAYEARAIWDYWMRELGAYCMSNPYELNGRPVQFRLAATQIIQCARKAADLAIQIVGASDSKIAEPMERAHRDLVVLGSHYVYRWDESMETAGRTFLDGLFPSD